MFTLFYKFYSDNFFNGNLYIYGKIRRVPYVNKNPNNNYSILISADKYKLLTLRRKTGAA